MANGGGASGQEIAGREIAEHDTPAEVDATFRTLRRVAVGYFAVFLVAVTGVPALSLTLGWWSQSRLIGGMSPGFAMAAFGLYAFFFLIGLAAASLSTAVEARMLGGPHEDPASIDDPLEPEPAALPPGVQPPMTLQPRTPPPMTLQPRTPPPAAGPGGRA